MNKACVVVLTAAAAPPLFMLCLVNFLNHPDVRCIRINCHNTELVERYAGASAQLLLAGGNVGLVLGALIACIEHAALTPILRRGLTAAAEKVVWLCRACGRRLAAAAAGAASLWHSFGCMLASLPNSSYRRVQLYVDIVRLSLCALLIVAPLYQVDRLTSCVAFGALSVFSNALVTVERSKRVLEQWRIVNYQLRVEFIMDTLSWAILVMLLLLYTEHWIGMGVAAIILGLLLGSVLCLPFPLCLSK